MNEVLFGYRFVSGVPLCLCDDPGNYIMASSTDDPLVIQLRCWCGSTRNMIFDNETERDEWVKTQSGSNNQEE